MRQPIRIGTRGSALALWQANYVAALLHNEGAKAEIIVIHSEGDLDQRPVQIVGEEGIFTKALQKELLEGTIDLIVHSLKDLPTADVQGLALGAVPVRSSVWDVLISGSGLSLQELSPGSSIATGSPRRQAQILRIRPDLHVVPIRGNVDTRLRKLDAGDFEALVLAEAGLLRLQLAHRISEVFDADRMLPAVGQGALGLEIRYDDAKLKSLLVPLDDLATNLAVTAERTLMRSLQGGCSAPVGARCYAASPLELVLEACVLSLDGRRELRAQLRVWLEPESTRAEQLARSAELGRDVADHLLQRGARELIDAARQAMDLSE